MNYTCVLYMRSTLIPLHLYRSIYFPAPGEVRHVLSLPSPALLLLCPMESTRCSKYVAFTVTCFGKYSLCDLDTIRKKTANVSGRTRPVSQEKAATVVRDASRFDADLVYVALTMPMPLVQRTSNSSFLLL